MIFALLKAPTLYFLMAIPSSPRTWISSWQHGAQSEERLGPGEERELSESVWWSHGFLSLYNPNKWVDCMFSFLSGCYGNTAQLFLKFLPSVKCVTLTRVAFARPCGMWWQLFQLSASKQEQQNHQVEKRLRSRSMRWGMSNPSYLILASEPGIRTAGDWTGPRNQGPWAGSPNISESSVFCSGIIWMTEHLWMHPNFSYRHSVPFFLHKLYFGIVLKL